MAKFYVGQRVRIKWSEGWPELAGQEGVLVPVPVGEFDCVGLRVANPDGNPWACAPDCWGSSLAPYPGRGERYGFAECFGPSPDQIEPILYDGNQLVRWDACLWQPQGVEA